RALVNLVRAHDRIEQHVVEHARDDAEQTLQALPVDALRVLAQLRAAQNRQAGRAVNAQGVVEQRAVELRRRVHQIGDGIARADVEGAGGGATRQVQVDQQRLGV